MLLMVLHSFANFHKGLIKGAMSVNTNCSGMLRTSSKLQSAQREHQACRVRIHANEPATAWADPPRLI